MKKIAIILFYTLASVGVIDITIQLITAGDVKLIQTILKFIFGGL